MKHGNEREREREREREVESESEKVPLVYPVKGLINSFTNLVF